MSLRIGVLGSTRGTALQGILDALEADTLDADTLEARTPEARTPVARTLDIDLALIVSDRQHSGILERAARHRVPSLFLDATGLTRADYDARVTAALQAARVDLVLMIGYMRIVSPQFVAQWQGRLLNVHPSLLPAFGGLMNKSVHQAVLAAGVTETGCTIHQVTEDVDAGPIVLQLRCPVLPDDTVDSLKDRVQALEQRAFVEVLRNWRA